MSKFKIFVEVLEILFGLGIMIAAILFEAEAWVIAAGLALMLWGLFNISKELRDSRADSDVASMSEERERIKRGE